MSRSSSSSSERATQGAKDTFETFVKPSLGDSDAEGQAQLEHKAIPSEKTHVDQQILIKRQIRDDILDQELEHHEETVMTESLIGDLTPKPKVAFGDEPDSKVEDVTTVAAEFVESLTEQAMKMSEEIIRSREELLEEGNKVLAAKEAARDFLDEMNQKAIEIAEQISRTASEEDVIGTKQRHSVEISDGELETDMAEFRQELEARVEYPADFRLITSFYAHYVRDLDEYPTDDDTEVAHRQGGQVETRLEPDQEDIWAAEAQNLSLQSFEPRIKKSDESSSKTSTTNRNSGTDWSSDAYLTAAESSSRSRPSSSDVDLMLSAQSGRSSTVTTEYETAHSSHDTSYHTAVSSLTSKESLRSTDISEASTGGNLASYEISETSETLMDAALDYERLTPSGAPEDEEPQTPDSPEVMPHMVRSAEMIFEQPKEEGSNLEDSRENLGASVLTISSNSEATVVTTQPPDEPPLIQIEHKAVEHSDSVFSDSGKSSESKAVSFEPNVSFETYTQRSVDSAEYDSRPESELKDFESRPHSISEAMLSDPPPRPQSKEDMSDPETGSTLKIRDPFARPITPEPPEKVVVKDTVEFSEEALEEAEIAFSKHFTQVVEESSLEFERLEEVPEVQIMTAVDLESPEVLDEPKWSEGDDYQYMYNQPLDQIAEEDEESHDLSKLRETLNNTGDFEIQRRNLVLKGDDNSSMSSLQEFENLEAQVLGSGTLSRGSMGSQDSLETPSKSHLRKVVVKDDNSVHSASSLTEFETMEEACQEAENIEKRAKEQEDVLSEIEEGHESQISESSDSCETMSEGAADEDEVDDPEEFEARLFQIDEIIKQAQTNVEQFDSAMSISQQSVPLEDILGAAPSTKKVVDTLSSAEDSDSLEVQLLPDSGVDSSAAQQEVMQASIDSLDLKQKVDGVMQLSTDSIDKGGPRWSSARTASRTSSPS